MKVEEQAPTTAARAAVLTATVGLPAVSCAALRQVSGMDGGRGDRTRSMSFFVAAWVPMTAGMMCQVRFRQP